MYGSAGGTGVNEDASGTASSNGPARTAAQAPLQQTMSPQMLNLLVHPCALPLFYQFTEVLNLTAQQALGQVIDSWRETVNDDQYERNKWLDSRIEPPNIKYPYAITEVIKCRQGQIGFLNPADHDTFNKNGAAEGFEKFVLPGVQTHFVQDFLDPLWCCGPLRACCGCACCVVTCGARGLAIK